MNGRLDHSIAECDAGRLDIREIERILHAACLQFGGRESSVLIDKLI